MCIAGLTFLSKCRIVFLLLPSLRLVCTGHTQTVVSVFSVLPYYKKNIKSRSVNAHIHASMSKSLRVSLSLIRHETQRERMSARGNSFSLQMDLEGVELGTTTEVYSLLHTLPRFNCTNTYPCGSMIFTKHAGYIGTS